jgi:hypothetical protein
VSAGAPQGRRLATVDEDVDDARSSRRSGEAIGNSAGVKR